MKQNRNKSGVVSFGKPSYCPVCGLGGHCGPSGPSGRRFALYKLLVFSLQLLVFSLGELSVFAGKNIWAFSHRGTEFTEERAETRSHEGTEEEKSAF